MAALHDVEGDVGQASSGHAEGCPAGNVEWKMGPDELAACTHKHRYDPRQLRRRTRKQPGTDDGQRGRHRGVP